MKAIFKSRKITVFIIIAICLVLAIGTLSYIKGSKGISVESETIVKGRIENFLEEDGTVRSRVERVVSSKVSGELLDLKVKEGDKVNAGDIIAVVDSHELELRVKGLQSQISAMKSQYQEAIKPVKDKEKQNAKSLVASAQLVYDEALLSHQSREELYKNGAISKDEFTKSLNQLELRKKELDVAKNNFALLNEGISADLQNKYEAQIAEVIYQKEILEESLENTSIRASVSGTITEIKPRLGEILTPGYRVAEISDLGNLYIESSVLSSKINTIKPDAPVYIEPEDSQEILGKVTRIYPKAYSQISDLGIDQKRVKIEISVNSSDSIRVGNELLCNISTGIREEVLKLPKDSVFYIGDRPHVFRVDGDKIVKTEVTIGFEGKDYFELVKGLKEKDIVVNAPNNELEDGVRVELKK